MNSQSIILEHCWPEVQLSTLLKGKFLAQIIFCTYQIFLRLEDFERFVISIFLKSTCLVFLHHKCDELKIFLRPNYEIPIIFNWNFSDKFLFLHLKIFVRDLSFFPTNKSNYVISSFHWARRQIAISIFFFNSSPVTMLSNQKSACCGFELAGPCYLLIACILVTGIFLKSKPLVFLPHRGKRLKTTLSDRFLVWKWHWLYWEYSTY